MRVLFVTRHPKLGYSIGKVFTPIIEGMRQYCEVESIILPIPSASPVSLVKNVIFVRNHINKGNFDVIHITGDSHYLIPFLGNKNICCTVHDLGFVKTEKGFLKKIWNYFLWIYSLRFAKRLAYISEKSMIEANNLVHLDDNKQCVIPNAVGREYVYYPKLSLPEKKCILHIGTFPRKNLLNTIEAIKGENYYLRIVGKLDEEHQKKLKAYNIDYSVVSGLSNEQIVEEYNQCDAVNFPSLYEGFGLPIIEGQAVGRPVLTSNLSPMKEIAGNGAVLVDPYSPKSIKEGYKYIFANYDKIVQFGVENVKKYNLDIVVSAYYKLYLSMVKNP